MRANRYLVAFVGVALAVSSALPGVASAQDEKWQQAFKAYSEQNYTEAESLFREVCAFYQDEGVPWGWCHMMLGVTLGNMGPSNRAEALAELDIANELAATDQDRYETNFAIANIQLLEKRWGQAIAAANEAERFSGNEQAAKIAKVKGQAYYQQQDWANAAAQLEAATSALAGDANLHAWLGRSYFELDQRDEALPQLTQATQIDRSNRVGLYFAARIHFDNENLTQAIALSERALQSHPQDTNIRNLLGMSYLGADRFADATQHFEVVIAERPNDAIAIYNLGQTHLAQEDWADAAEQFQKAQNLFEAGSSTQGALLYDLGLAFERLDRNEDALRAYTDSQSINDTTTVEDAIDRVQERIRRAKGKVAATPST